MLFNFKPQRLLACLMTACIVSPAFAQQQDSQSQRQQRDSQQRRSQDQRSQDQRSQDQRDRQSQQRSRNQEDRQWTQQGDSRSQDSRSRVSVVPQGWVSLAVDYDNDGSYDGFETIYIYDLRMAQQRSRDRQQSGQSGSQEGRSQQQSGMQNQDQRRMSQRQTDQRRSDQQRMNQRSGEQRMNQQRGNRMDPRRTAQRDQQSDQQRRSPTQHLTGTVQNIKQLTMHDGENKIKVAKVKTQEGRTARVLLGKSQEVDRLNLKDGDRVQIQGRRGMVNDRPVLVANSIRSGDQFAQVEFDESRPLRKYTGSVEQTRTTRFQNREGVFLIARLEGENGESHIVNMGRTGKISPSAVKNADEVCVLATEGKVNGQEALIAEEISVDGRKIELGGDEDRRPSNWTISEQQDRDQGNQRNSNQGSDY